MSAQLNGRAERQQLALEVQTEALRPTAQVHHSLRERLNDALERIRLLRVQIVTLERQKRENHAQFQREIARQREELGISDTWSRYLLARIWKCLPAEEGTAGTSGATKSPTT